MENVVQPAHCNLLQAQDISQKSENVQYKENILA